jgi:hypothetical protein
MFTVRKGGNRAGASLAGSRRVVALPAVSSATGVGRLVLDLAPDTAWGARTQTLSVPGSTTGSALSTITGSAVDARPNYTADTGSPDGQPSAAVIG